MIRNYILYIILIPVLSLSCNNNTTPVEESQSSYRDLTGIIERGRLTAVTDFNSTNYFLYRGTPMGFNYELLGRFAGHLGVELEIISENDRRKAIRMLNNGEADIIAMGFPVNGLYEEELSLTSVIHETREVLVQRKPEKWRTMSAERLERELLRSHFDLAGKVVYVPEGSHYPSRISMLQQEIGDTVYTVELPYDPEGLVSLVAKGEIDYTICDENFAMVAGSFYPDIDIAMPVSFTQKRAWAMRRHGSDRLAAVFAEWFTSYRTTVEYAILYSNYFKNSRSERIYTSRYYSNNTGRISQWDELIKRYSDSISWDWRLLASLIYQESRFDPSARSGAGAYGLMQIMPSTGAYFGIDPAASPESNIRAGVMYIRWLERMFSERIPDDEERLRFILASYNAGPGHVLDAMRLADSEGSDSTTWHGSVESYILRKSQPGYYDHPEVQHGYFRGRETVAFVAQIMDRYDHYRNIIK